MSFFTHMKHVLFGAPEPGKPQSPHAQAQEQAPTSFDIRGTQKVSPKLYVEDADSHINGQKMDVRCVIKNESDVEVFLDKIRLLGSKRELDTRLRPGEARNFLVYSGPLPNNRNYGTAEIDFHREGDYFQTKCQVEFNQEQDGRYSVRSINAVGATKDI